MNVRLIWVDADCPPIFEWTEEAVDGSHVFATFTAAKAVGLAALRDAKERVSSAIAALRETTKEDVQW